ncbi:MAG: energy-coupling factor transporter transmembrane component T [Clostridia bacterium]|nr:energy-coupling factor transporter transmembrane component T [Clostridia bacterium]
MGNKITLGQFIPGDSVVHRLDPRTKILLMVAFIVLVFVVKSLPVFLIPAAFVIAVVMLAKVPVSYLKNAIKPIRWLLLFMFIINIFVTPGEKELLHFWIFRITEESLTQAVYITVRLVLLVSGTSLLTLTTSPIRLTDGIEKLFSPFARFGFPAHELAMMMTIALRFIPTLMEEVDRIRKAQTARGADFTSGNIIERAKAMLPILIPLFVSAFRRADELAMAMESRCYRGGEGRTRMVELKLGKIDAVAFVVTAAVFASVILLNGVLA